MRRRQTYVYTQMDTQMDNSKTQLSFLLKFTVKNHSKKYRDKLTKLDYWHDAAAPLGVSKV